MADSGARNPPGHILFAVQDPNIPCPETALVRQSFRERLVDTILGLPSGTGVIITDAKFQATPFATNYVAQLRALDAHPWCSVSVLGEPGQDLGGKIYFWRSVSDRSRGAARVNQFSAAINRAPSHIWCAQYSRWGRRVVLFSGARLFTCSKRIAVYSQGRPPLLPRLGSLGIP